MSDTDQAIYTVTLVEGGPERSNLGDVMTIALLVDDSWKVGDPWDPVIHNPDGTPGLNRRARPVMVMREQQVGELAWLLDLEWLDPRLVPVHELNEATGLYVPVQGRVRVERVGTYVHQPKRGAA